MLLPFLFQACTETGPPPEIPEPGVSWELAEHRKATLTDLRYTLNVSVPRLRAERLHGTNTVHFQLNSAAEAIVLDFKVPSADYLHGVSQAGEAVEYIFENGHIVIPARYFQEGENEVSLEFDLGDQSLNRQEEFLYTLLVPDRASTAIPCFDQPNLKARYQLTLNIPQEWEALANGALEKETIQDSVKTLQYAATRPLPTYLFDFVVGDFQTITSELGGRKMTMLHRETDTLSVLRNAQAIFDLHLSALNWLEDYTGIKMPFQKFDFALIPSFQYGGMEHPGAITYKASSLFLDENATQNQELGRASLIAHETAHMWFGNLVTMNWFDDVWMKEVFANFMAAKIVNPSFPEINHDLRFTLAHYPGAYSVDRTAGTHPIQQPLANLKDAGTLYGAIIYQKAPIVMRMLEKQIGEAAMRAGLQKYLTTYSYNNATWDDLIDILDRQTEDDLDAWNQQWIKQAGMPHLALDTEGEDGIKSIRMRVTNAGGSTMWSQPLQITTFDENGTSTYQMEVNQAENTLELGELAPRPEMIIPNAGGYGYGYFQLGAASKTYLLARINQLEEPMWRGVSWINLWENLLNDNLEPTSLLPTMLEGISVEPDPLLRQRILGYLSSLYWNFLPEPDRKSVNAQVEAALWTAFEQTEDKRLKTALFNTYRSVVESPEGVQRLQAIWSKELEVEGLSLSENDYIELAFQLAVRDVPHSVDLIDQQIDRTKNADRQARMRFVKPALSPNEATRDEFFNSLKQEENRQVESWVQEALGWLHHPLRAASAEKYITPTLEMLEEIQATGDIFFPKRVLDNTFSGHRSESVVEAVKQFLADRPDYPENLRNKILQASDETFRAVGR
ncbi:peptidase M1 [Flavilitoribacter nigricans DSM 23189 = NBRC 102662]|uniref:Aminopeptidase N n=2 Tax=Flavilitoribacter TaxID=2762562 RepID=A0A2D0NIK6_FLAN2|nr:peptidase M1 [Flavilitoribacter nigricans DSM 23189 = NBRC 102662]